MHADGRKLWRSITAEFDLESEPHKLQTIAELDDAAADAPLTVKGSMGQPVISPFIAEARAQRSLLAQLLALLNFGVIDLIRVRLTKQDPRSRADFLRDMRTKQAAGQLVNPATTALLDRLERAI